MSTSCKSSYSGFLDVSRSNGELIELVNVTHCSEQSVSKSSKSKSKSSLSYFTVSIKVILIHSCCKIPIKYKTLYLYLSCCQHGCS